MANLVLGFGREQKSAPLFYFPFFYFMERRSQGQKESHLQGLSLLQIQLCTTNHNNWEPSWISTYNMMIPHIPTLSQRAPCALCSLSEWKTFPSSNQSCDELGCVAKFWWVWLMNSFTLSTPSFLFRQKKCPQMGYYLLHSKKAHENILLF